MKITKFFKRKRVIWIIVILIAVAFASYFVFIRGKNNASSIQTNIVKKQNLRQTVLATGQVISGTDINLSFQASGKVGQVLVKEGDKVRAGQILAILDQTSAQAALTSANGDLAQTQANLKKIIAGATEEEINVSRAAVATAKINLDNDYQSLLNGMNIAATQADTALRKEIDGLFNNPETSNPALTYQTVNAQAQLAGESKLVVALRELNNWESELAKFNSFSSQSSIYDEYLKSKNHLAVIKDFLNSVMDTLVGAVITPTVTRAIITGYKTNIDSARTSMDEQNSDLTSFAQSVQSDQSSLDQAIASLNLKIALATEADIDKAQAQVISAEGQVALAQATLNNTILKSPDNGTITEIDIKKGEQAAATTSVMMLQDINNLHTEADVSEANIASLAIGQSIDYTFDAFGPDRHFEGTIININPASTIVSGVVNYRVKGALKDIPGIKPGMTANMTILVAKKDNALAVPLTAVINKDNNQYARVVDDPQKKTYKEVQVQTGLQADGGLVEILSGLKEGEEIVVYIKK